MIISFILIAINVICNNDSILNLDIVCVLYYIKIDVPQGSISVGPRFVHNRNNN